MRSITDPPVPAPVDYVRQRYPDRDPLGRRAQHMGSITYMDDAIGDGRHPSALRWPGTVAANTTSDAFLTALEIFPTFTRLASASMPAGIVFDGYDVVDVFIDGAASPRTEMYWEFRHERAARVGDWKWVDSKGGSGLFNLDQDRNESNDLSHERPSVRQELLRHYAAWQNRMDVAEPRGPFRDY